MNYDEIKDRLDEELAKRGLRLVWKPHLSPQKPELLVVFGAEQSKEDTGERLIAGFRGGNTPDEVITGYVERFLEVLESVGVPRSSLHSAYSQVGRGKIWPTFIARLTQETYKALDTPRLDR